MSTQTFQQGSLELLHETKDYLNNCPYSRQTPSPRYQELLSQYQHLHAHGSDALSAEKHFSGISLQPHFQAIYPMFKKHDIQSLLDYGAGKGQQYQATFGPNKLGLDPNKTLLEHLGVSKLCRYDPGYEPFSQLPLIQYDGVICTDVIEHLPEEDIPWILMEIFDYAKKAVFLSVACYPASKTLPNGENAHCTVKSPQWWQHVFYNFREMYPHLDFAAIISVGK